MIGNNPFDFVDFSARFDHFRRLLHNEIRAQTVIVQSTEQVWNSGCMWNNSLETFAKRHFGVEPFCKCSRHDCI